ncbi:MAG: hypothetical protein ACRDPT_08085 [Streptomycetales bacterium]
MWLTSLEARASALLGDVETTHAAIARAEDARERITRDELDEIGGILTFPRPQQLYYVADTMVSLPAQSSQAEEHAVLAVHAYEHAEPHEWAFSDEADAPGSLRSRESFGDQGDRLAGMSGVVA